MIQDYAYPNIELGAVRPVGLHGYDAKAVSVATQPVWSGEVLTQQAFAEEADINVLMRRLVTSRELPLGPATGVYGDFSGIADYQDALDRITGAQERFMKLPAEVRDRFDNDPGKLIAMASSMDADGFVSMFEETAVEPPAPKVLDMSVEDFRSVFKQPSGGSGQ